MNGDVEQRLRDLANLIAASPHNLVSRGERERLYETHVRECVAYAPHLRLSPGARWLDLGTGGGLPGLALAILCPEVHWTLLDSVGKKADAVADFAQALNLTNVDVVCGRAEELARQPALRGAFDGVIARAVAELRIVLELMRGFVRKDGILVAVKGPRWQEELAGARAALPLLRLESAADIPIPSAPRPTWLVIMRASGQPPEDFPRRTGIPQARPLGGP